MERLPWELLDKYFKKQIINSELHILENWIAESEEHALLFEEIEANIKSGLPFPGNFNEDTIKTWSELKEDFNIPHYFNIPLDKIYFLAAIIMMPLWQVGEYGCNLA